MSSVANVFIHASQFPENVRRDLLESLRSRQVNHKFHYDSIKQTQKWLALHQHYSPSRNDPYVSAIYDRSFEAAVQKVRARAVQLIGLGCGGGQKDTRLLELLKAAGKEVFYTPCDVSTAMVLVAREAALAAIPEQNCFPFVCDLASATGLSAAFKTHGPREAARLVSFFGMIPNFEPEVILPKLGELMGPEDHLLFSANLAPGLDYPRGMQRILPQYENALTREWLMTFLLDLGVEREDGELRFSVGGDHLKRVEVTFHFNRPRQVMIESEHFNFAAGDSIRLFFSYRYTPKLAQEVLDWHGFKVTGQWIAPSEEEGVFLTTAR